MTRRRKLTMSEIAAQAASRPVAPEVPRRFWGRVFDGKLWAPSGCPLGLFVKSISPADAQRSVVEGAQVCWDACGCGGQWCEPVWADAQELELLCAVEPRTTRGSAPTWIDLWASESGERVVFLHGDFEWGALGR